MTDILVEVAGWSGLILLLSAYGLLSSGKIESTSVSYQLLNLFGAILTLINTLYHGAFPPTVLNVFWIIIGLLALSKIARKKRKVES
jgi:hypothetical protein